MSVDKVYVGVGFSQWANLDQRFRLPHLKIAVPATSPEYTEIEYTHQKLPYKLLISVTNIILHQEKNDIRIKLVIYMNNFEVNYNCTRNEIIIICMFENCPHKLDMFNVGVQNACFSVV